MPRRVPSAVSPPTDAEGIDRLTAAVADLAGQVEVFRQVLDELRDDLQWVIRNPDAFRIPPNVLHVTSVPADPCAPDFGARINRLKPENLPPDNEPLPPPPPAAPTAPPPQRPAEKPTSSRTAKKRRPLATRMYFQAHLTELVRLIGYQGLPVTEARERLKPLSEQYGKEKMEAAVEEIVHIDESTKPPIARLTEQARKVAFALLGPPPSPAATEPHSPPKDGT